MSLNYFTQSNQLGITYPNSGINYIAQSGRADRNKMYLNELKDQMKQHQKPNKLEEYKHKIIEREEMNKLNSYNPFGRPGNGAPLESRNFNKNYSGTNHQGGLNNILNTGNMSLNQNQLINPNTDYNSRINYNSNLNKITPFILENYPSGMNNSRTISSRFNSSNRMAYNTQAIPNYENKLVSVNPKIHINALANNYHTISDQYDDIQNNLHDRSNTNIDVPKIVEKRINEVRLVPNQDKDQKQLKVINYQNELRTQIEEKKKKAEEEKRKEIELDLLEEEKYKKFLQNKKQQEEDQKNKRKHGMKFHLQEENQEKSSNNIPPNNTYNNMTIKSPNQLAEKEKFIQQKENDTPNNNIYEQNLENDELQSFQQMIGLTYENLRENIKEDATTQLYRLKSEVEKQYNEMNEIFHKLRMDVKEVSDMKFDAERELNKIREEIEKKKITSIMYENKLNSVLEKYAPHNYTNIPINEVHPLFTKEKRKRHLNLDSVSTMIYNQERFENGELVNTNNNKFSNIAQRGQDLIGVSEFVPITNNSNSIEKKNKQFNMNENIISNLENEKEMSLNGDYQDMLAKLEKIAEFNNKIDPSAKFKTLNRELSDKIENRKYNDYYPSDLETLLQNVKSTDKNYKFFTTQNPGNELLNQGFYKVESTTGNNREVNNYISNTKDIKIFIDESNV